ncbi:MAG: aminotransferase class V-fold PLP-dependent enzyme, partial [Acidimicrobiales bacterium]
MEQPAKGAERTPGGPSRPTSDDRADAVPAAPARLVGDGLLVPCIDGSDRPYVNLDFAASTSALTDVADAVAAFLPTYSSVHRGAGFKSRRATAAYESARAAALAFCGQRPGDDVAVVCRNTTEAINQLAYRLRL